MRGEADHPVGGGDLTRLSPCAWHLDNHDACTNEGDTTVAWSCSAIARRRSPHLDVRSSKMA
ncbi:hypothetical protein CUJ84_pRLN3000467 (plasmid) [Rhizobium leguminosarum]|uniref:Uncharacterized protein n=1 Tax=Rhizobium leguminosarum TaxID=384 RepID=A0A2K9ZH72_RHILE|nr:hypothetical protein CUJ84_pRLN3000467 [Rhizobium leguminosarum]